VTSPRGISGAPLIQQLMRTTVKMRRDGVWFEDIVHTPTSEVDGNRTRPVKCSSPTPTFAKHVRGKSACAGVGGRGILRG